MNKTFIAICAGIAAISLAAGYGAGILTGGGTGSPTGSAGMQSKQPG